MIDSLLQNAITIYRGAGDEGLMNWVSGLPHAEQEILFIGINRMTVGILILSKIIRSALTGRVDDMIAGQIAEDVKLLWQNLDV
jgi:hypothetical protein